MPYTQSKNKRAPLSRKDRNALRLLLSASPDAGKTAITSNEVSASPEYDLQIVLPVYNAAQYLAECIDSVLPQLYGKYKAQLVIVDDGSTDNSPKIISQYASLPGVQVISQENKGFSEARNAALREINAKYVFFLDSDDILAPRAVQLLLDEAEGMGADIVEGGHTYFGVAGRQAVVRRPEHYRGTDWLRLNGTPWAKVYRASLFKGLRFPPGYWFEDSLGPLLLFPLCRTVSQIPNEVYRYRANPDGISHRSHGSTRNIDALWVSHSLLSDARRLKHDFSPALLQAFLRDTRCSLNRLSAVPDRKIQDAAFRTVCCLCQTYFPGVSTEGLRDRLLLLTLRTRQRTLYRVLRRLHVI